MPPFRPSAIGRKCEICGSPRGSAINRAFAGLKNCAAGRSGVRRPAQGQALRRCSFNLVRNLAPDFLPIGITLATKLLGPGFGFVVGVAPIMRQAESRIDSNGILTRRNPHIELHCFNFPEPRADAGNPSQNANRDGNYDRSRQVHGTPTIEMCGELAVPDSCLVL